MIVAAVPEAGPSSPFPLTITPNASNPGNYDFSWGSQDGKLYDLVSATDLSTAPDTWPVYLGNADIEGTSPTNTLVIVPGGADPERYFAVLEKDPPPLLEEDFAANCGQNSIVGSPHCRSNRIPNVFPSSAGTSAR